MSTDRGRWSELDEKLRRFSRRAESGSPARIIRSEPKPQASDCFRSGWSRPPQVTAPLSFLPARENPSTAEKRSSSAPSLHSLAKDGHVARGLELRRSTSSSSSSAKRGTGDQLKPQEHGRSNLEVPSASFADRVASRSSSPAGTSWGVQAEDTSSDAGMSIESGRTSMHSLNNTALTGNQLSHEGWLGKLTSGTISARWQRRYFRLEGCMLRYSHTPNGGAPKRSFDLRRAEKLTIAQDQPRQLELDFGFRVWRLRAESAEAARRWLLLLEAGQLLGGSKNGCQGLEAECEGSDDDSACSIARSQSSTTVDSATSGEPLTPKFGANQNKSSLHPAPAIVDVLELDSKALDLRFEDWLSVLQAQRHDDKQLHSFAGPGMSRARRTLPSTGESAQKVCDGLGKVFGGLWEDLCSGSGCSQETLHNQAGQLRAAQRAVQALKEYSGPVNQPRVVRETLEGFLGEYLSRIRLHLERWLQLYDPAANEVACVTRWLLFEAWPALHHLLDRAAEIVEGPLDHCLGAMTSLEKVLLTEWEARSCDEAFWICEDTFACSDAGKNQPRTCAILRLLETAAASGNTWQGHVEALDRATSILIATLNAALRSFRTFARLLHVASQFREEQQQQPEASGPPARGRNRSRKVTRTIQRLGRQAFLELQKAASCADMSNVEDAGPSTTALALLEASELAAFCQEAAPKQRQLGCPASVAGLCEEVLSAFAAAFEAEAASLAWALAKLHFERQHSSTVKAAGAYTGSQLPRFVVQGQGHLAVHAAPAAADFLGSVLSAAGGRSLRPEGLRLARQLGGRALAQLLAAAWVRHFTRRPPRASAWGEALAVAIAADEAALRNLEGAQEADSHAEPLRLATEAVRSGRVEVDLCDLLKNA